MNTHNQIHSANTPTHYDKIPQYCFKEGGSILDLGCMSGLNALISKNRSYFLEAEANKKYLGLDLLVYPKNYLEPIIIGDIRDFWTDKSFDLVLALHVMEHIEVECWDYVIRKLQQFVKPDGYLIIDTPHKSRNPESEDPNPHVVFDIDKDLIRSFLPDAEIFKYRISYPFFREKGESLIWAFSRAVWRLLIRHKYRYYRPHCIVAIWKKGVKT